MAQKSGADLFGTFLETVQKRSTAQQKRPGGTWLLSRLNESGAQPIPDLLASSNMSFSDFTTMLTTMQDAGLVTLEGEPGEEQVTLTPTGKQAAGAMS
jgi:predicted transcriptional regulator